MLSVGAGVAWWFTLPAIYLFRAVALYGLVSTLVLRHLPLPMPGTGLGPANRVTLGRATLVLALAALVPQPQVGINGGDWFIIGLATVALCLDGVDGWLARRTGNTTRFGARFDMELDSLLMLVLAALVWRSGNVPRVTPLCVLRGWLVLGVAQEPVAGAASSKGGLRSPGHYVARLSRPHRARAPRGRRSRRDFRPPLDLVRRRCSLVVPSGQCITRVSVWRALQPLVSLHPGHGR